MEAGLFRLAGCAALIAAMVGCGWSEGRYLERSAEATCEWTVECYPDLYEDLDACLADLTQDPADDCDYDRKSARKCVKAIEDLDCPGPAGVPELPEACRDVYDCPLEDTGG